MGIDVGIANFLTTSTGRQYRTFHGKLAARHERDRQTRRRKAKLRACLKRQGVQYLPSTRNRTLARHVRQEINRAVNAVSREHPDAQFAYEQLNVAGMKFKARRMTADLYAANLAHTLPIWPTFRLSSPGARPGAAAERVRSRAHTVPRNARAVIRCPARTVPTNRRSVVWSAGIACRRT